jgi:hypothetical protein
VYGNHDGLVQGNAPLLAAFEAISVSELKVVGVPDGLSPAALERVLTQQDLGSLFGGAIEGALEGDPTALRHAAGAPVRLVTADPKRAYVHPEDWVRMHRQDTRRPRARPGTGCPRKRPRRASCTTPSRSRPA